MIKARVGNNFIFGLSNQNIMRLQESKPIIFDFALMGGPPNSNVVICYGATENDIVEYLRTQGVEGLPQPAEGTTFPDAPEGLDHGERYPRGKLNKHDEGAMSMAMAVKDNTVILDFGRPVKWLGLGLSDLERLIAGLQAKADVLRKASV